MTHPPTDKTDPAQLERMLATIRAHGFHDERILAALAAVPRDRFIPAAWLGQVDPWGDHPALIGEGQTISQPFIVAHMTGCLQPQPGEKILEIGAGSGYQAAVLAQLGARVYSLEILPELAQHARGILAELGYANVRVQAGDGWRGWPEEAPFDGILVACAADKMPAALLEQLQDGGRMIAPVGTDGQQLLLIRRAGAKYSVRKDLPVRFVPMVHVKERTAE